MSNSTSKAQAQAKDDSKGEAQGATFYGVEALAEATGASSKDVRRWLRAQAREAGAGDVLPGKGGRYAFDAPTIEALARAYGASKARKGTAEAGRMIAARLTASE
jgi:hypothetical protein